MLTSKQIRFRLLGAIRKWQHWLAGLFLVCLGLSVCRAADVVLIHKGNARSSEEEAIQRVADFYGLNVQVLNADAPDASRERAALTNPETVAVAMSQEALSELNGNEFRAALSQRKGSHLPILIFGIEPGKGLAGSKFLLADTIRNCSPIAKDSRPKFLEVGSSDAITNELAGFKLPAVANPSCQIQFEPTPTIHRELFISDGSATDGAAVLLRSQTSSGDVFFTPRMNLSDSSWIGKQTGMSKSFSWFAPYVMFLSYAAGDYGWHSPGHYANLTIDDAWLIQPYGFLDYKALLSEMEKHNFHTTVAFIPWNFDRSRPEVVSLFKSNPSRYSVCVHGNNHAHREFGEYRTNPLSNQINDIKQGIARMEQFTARTHIPYDKFMVFPHGVAPEPTFAALRTYGFMGTANASNMPTDAPAPRDPMFFLRPFTSNYANFLSLYRYPSAGDVPKLEIAIHAFLGNPILFYDHSNLFNSGIGAFNAHADFINKIQPGTQWTTLGEIARHSYLMRKRVSGGIDVLMMSSEMELENPTDATQVFYIHRHDTPGEGGTLTANGLLTHSSGSSEVSIAVPAHESRLLRVAYANDLNVARENVRSRNLYAYALRMISDFRDLYLSKSSFGESFIRNYYRNKWDSAELVMERNWWVIVIFILLGFGAVRYCGNRMQRHTSQSTRQ